MRHLINKILFRFGYVQLNTSDNEFIGLLERARSEIHSRFGVEACKELHASCPDCRARYLVGLINEQIDMLK